MNVDEIKEFYQNELEFIDNELHYQENVNTDLLNDVGVESYCENADIFELPDYYIGYVRGMKDILNLLEGGKL